MKADEWSEIQISLRFLAGDGVTSDSDLDRILPRLAEFCPKFCQQIVPGPRLLYGNVPDSLTFSE